MWQCVSEVVCKENVDEGCESLKLSTSGTVFQLGVRQSLVATVTAGTKTYCDLSVDEGSRPADVSVDCYTSGRIEGAEVGACLKVSESCSESNCEKRKEQCWRSHGSLESLGLDNLIKGY